MGQLAQPKPKVPILKPLPVAEAEAVAVEELAAAKEVDDAIPPNDESPPDPAKGFFDALLAIAAAKGFVFAYARNPPPTEPAAVTPPPYIISINTYYLYGYRILIISTYRDWWILDGGLNM